MDCPKCGGNMEKGCIGLMGSGRFLGFEPNNIMWFCEETIEQYGKFPQSLFVKPDLRIYSNQQEVGYSGYKAYRCPKCKAVLIIPHEKQR